MLSWRSEAQYGPPQENRLQSQRPSPQASSSTATTYWTTTTYNRRRPVRRQFVLLHGWEYSVVGLIVVFALWYNTVLLALVLGHLGHFVGAHLGNRVSHPLTYSVLFRLRHGFARDQYYTYPAATLSDVMHRRIPLWSRVEPRVVKIVPRYMSNLTHAGPEHNIV